MFFKIHLYTRDPETLLNILEKDLYRYLIFLGCSREDIQTDKQTDGGTNKAQTIAYFSLSA